MHDSLCMGRAVVPKIRQVVNCLLFPHYLSVTWNHRGKGELPIFSLNQRWTDCADWLQPCCVWHQLPACPSSSLVLQIFSVCIQFKCEWKVRASVAHLYSASSNLIVFKVISSSFLKGTLVRALCREEKHSLWPFGGSCSVVLK